MKTLSLITLSSFHLHLSIFFRRIFFSFDEMKWLNHSTARSNLTKLVRAHLKKWCRTEFSVSFILFSFFNFFVQTFFIPALMYRSLKYVSSSFFVNNFCLVLSSKKINVSRTEQSWEPFRLLKNWRWIIMLHNQRIRERYCVSKSEQTVKLEIAF
jgi:hypothetical protein